MPETVEGVGAYIERRRKEIGATQGEIARRMRVSESSLNRTINNRNERYVPDLDYAVKLAQALEVEIWDIYRAAGVPDPRDADNEPLAAIRRGMATIAALPVNEETRAAALAVLRVVERELEMQRNGASDRG